MGKLMLTFIEETSGGDEKERRVLYEGMLDVDYAIFPTAKVELLQMVEAPEQLPTEMALQLANTFGRGVRVIVDKDSVTEKLKALVSKIGQPSPSLPTQDEFLELVNDFLYHSIWTAKHVMRGELWWSLTCLNCRLANQLRQMIEWQARATHGKDYDSWFRGRFLEAWAEPEALKGLEDSFARYTKQDAVAALKAAMDLFRKTATDTANKLNFKYPTDADKKIAEWIEIHLPSDH
jgi:aminoglycoside 6-adenylyltransferase